MLSDLASFLATHPVVVEKANIHLAYGNAEGLSGNIPLGDDTAAIPNPTGSGHLLFAAEGMLESFVVDDPWFAGYSAIMVNISDIAAMGGTPIAITDVLWTPDEELSKKIWEGMSAASLAYGVPIVGGHTTKTAKGNAALAASIIGHAGDHLITSFDASPGDLLTFAIDMNGAYRADKPFWNASTTATPEHLRKIISLLPEIAEKELCKAGKDISNGGIIGTLAMLCECSEVGATINLADVPKPVGVDWEKWLVSFPSYGYLLAIAPEHLLETNEIFAAHGITFQPIGTIDETPGIHLKDGDETEFVI